MSGGDTIKTIEERLHDHERELSRTLESIRDKMTSRELVGELYDRARTSGYTRALGRAVRDNPLPTVFAGVCAAWLGKSVRDAFVSERSAQKRLSQSEGETTLSEQALADAADERAFEARSESGGSEGEKAGTERVVQPPNARPDA